MTSREVVRHRLPDGREYETVHDWTYDEPPSVEGRLYMWTEGNWACDDNKSLFLMEQHPGCGIEDELPCGRTIGLVSIVLDGIQIYPEDGS